MANWNKEFSLNGLTAEENRKREDEVNKCCVCGKPAMRVRNRKGYCKDHQEMAKGKK